MRTATLIGAHRAPEIRPVLDDPLLLRFERVAETSELAARLQARLLVFRLGGMYEFGEGVERDEAKAAATMSRLRQAVIFSPNGRSPGKCSEGNTELPGF
jgi:hypothetical protein